MDLERYQRLRQAFGDLVGKSPETWDGAIAEACAGDEDLAFELRGMLEACGVWGTRVVCTLAACS